MQLSGRRATLVGGLMLAVLWSNPMPAPAQLLEAGATAPSEAVKLRADQVPPTWRLTSEYPLVGQQIANVRARYGIPLDSVLVQSFTVDGGAGIRLNYSSSPTESDSVLLSQRLVEYVGKANVIARVGRVVVELISVDNRLKETALELLPLPLVQKKKLSASRIPGPWFLVREITVTGKELEGFSLKFEAPLEEVVNQIFTVGRERVQLNYLACRTEEEARAVRDRLSAAVRGANPVLRNGTIVIEVIAESPESRKEAERLLGGPRE